MVVDEERKLDYAVKVQTRELDAVDGSTGLQLRRGRRQMQKGEEEGWDRTMTKEDD